MGDIMNLFNYYLDNQSLEGEVYNGNFLFLKCLAHYQTGQNKDLVVDANSIDLGKISQKEPGTVQPMSLFNLSFSNLLNPITWTNFANLSDEGLALGSFSITFTNSGIAINEDTYDFDFKLTHKYTVSINNQPISIMDWHFKRNLGNAISLFLHTVPFSGTHGTFKIRFVGEIK